MGWGVSNEANNYWTWHSYIKRLLLQLFLAPTHPSEVVVRGVDEGPWLERAVTRALQPRPVSIRDRKAARHELLPMLLP
jgi:hypothetical protein